MAKDFSTPEKWAGNSFSITGIPVQPNRVHFLNQGKWKNIILLWFGPVIMPISVQLEVIKLMSLPQIFVQPQYMYLNSPDHPSKPRQFSLLFDTCLGQYQRTCQQGVAESEASDYVSLSICPSLKTVMAVECSDWPVSTIPTLFCWSSRVLGNSPHLTCGSWFQTTPENFLIGFTNCLKYFIWRD